MGFNSGFKGLNSLWENSWHALTLHNLSCHKVHLQ